MSAETNGVAQANEKKADTNDGTEAADSANKAEPKKPKKIVHYHDLVVEEVTKCLSSKELNNLVELEVSWILLTPSWVQS